MSVTHLALGRSAEKSRSSRSGGAYCGRIAAGSAPPPAAAHALQAGPAHQPLHRAGGHRDALTVQLAPHLAGAVNTEVRLIRTARSRPSSGYLLGRAMAPSSKDQSLHEIRGGSNRCPGRVSQVLGRQLGQDIPSGLSITMGASLGQ